MAAHDQTGRPGIAGRSGELGDAMKRVFRPFADPDTYWAFVYYLGTVVLGSLGLALLIAGWTITIALSITPLVVVVLIGFGLAVGYLAAAEGGLARGLLDVNVRPAVGVSGTGFWGRGFAVLRAETFWKQQAHLFLAWLVAVVALAPFSLGFQTLAIPFYYQAVDGADLFGWTIDTFGEALLAVLIGLGLLATGIYLLVPLRKLSRGLATRLLAGEADRIVQSPEEVSARRLRALTITALITTSVVVVLILIWSLTTPDGYFWPIWPLLSLALVVGIPGWIVLALERREPARYALDSKALAIQIGVSAVLLGFLVGVWAVAGNGYFWPMWPALGLALAAAIHGAVTYGRREHRIRRLEETRAGAVDVQESELRRIERDLHDGAQARLVALGMSLGMAEQALEKDPEAVRALLAEARQGAGEALQELRDLARGIRPPLLTDRGLGPAISAFTARTPVPITLSLDVPDRYPSAVETAAYFTVAEALANAIKHANAKRIEIRIEAQGGMLVAEVLDDGVGGADANGRGFVGLRQRAEALDGTLHVESPVGGPTRVRVELPCGS
jgi:signal transduction histidine kinase